MNSLDALRARVRGNVPSGQPTKPTEPSFDGFVGSPQGTFYQSKPSEPMSKARLREWHGYLSKLDALSSPDAMDPGHWATLCDDAWWLYESHASYAVRQGWEADGLFGVRTGMPYGGGLAQFLRTSRKLVFDGPIAHISRMGVTSKLNPACGHGLPLIWELK